MRRFATAFASFTKISDSVDGICNKKHSKMREMAFQAFRLRVTFACFAIIGQFISGCTGAFESKADVLADPVSGVAVVRPVLALVGL